MLFNSGVQYNINPSGSSAVGDVSISNAAGKPAFIIIPTANLPLNNLLIDGQGSTMMVDNPSVGFLELKNGMNVIVQNFVVDYSALLYSTGIVQSVNASAKSFTYIVDQGQAPTTADMENANASWGYLLDPSDLGTGRVLYNGPKSIPIPTPRDATKAWVTTLYQITTNGHATLLSVGDRYVLLGRYDGSSSIYGHQCRRSASSTIPSTPDAATFR